MRWMILLILACFFYVPCGATTYYFSSSLGSDTNTSTQAQSKSTPWAHLPCMANASSNAASYHPAAGDSLIMYGGDSWTNASFPCTWAWSGSSGSAIYVGVDKTWYSGGSWVRPVWSAGGTTMGSTNNFVQNSGAGSYTTWDNIEFKGFVQSSTSYGHDAFMCLGACASSITHITVENCYFHDWTHGSQTTDNIWLILGDTNSPYLSGSVIDSNVADNSDGDEDSAYFLYAVSGTITHNIVKNLSNGILPLGGGVIAYNNTGPINTDYSATHENCFETLGGTTPTWYIHDNLCHDAVGESMMLGNNGETDYVWNNIAWNLSGNAMHFAQNNGQTITALYYWNNTIIPQAGAECFIEVFTPTIGTLDLRNNHCITTGTLSTSITGVSTLVGINTSGVNTDDNLLQTPTVATGQGYTSAEAFVYSPPNGSGSTVGGGTNLTSSWPGGYSTNDTTYACIEASGSGGMVSSCPARTSNARPSSGAWDIGAYEYQSAHSGSALASGTSMTGVVFQ